MDSQVHFPKSETKPNCHDRRISSKRRLPGPRHLALQKYSPKEVQQMVTDANLQGRGGAGFPAGLKWKSVADNFPFPRYIISNIDEYEPGTFKDRLMTHTDPHMIIEGHDHRRLCRFGGKEASFSSDPSYENSALISRKGVENCQGGRLPGQEYSRQQLLL